MEEISIKTLVSNGNMAKFSHAIAGVLYYRIDLEDESYQFCVDMNDKDDVGTATFNSEEKAIHLMRYLNKSKKSGDLVRVK
jgi:hypothetical protein